MPELNTKLFLIGFMGAGKSTVAKRLSEQLGAEMVEMDAQIEKEQGMSINDIFARYGEEEFRRLESDLIRRLAEGEPCIVSCGGGAVLKQENVELMKQGGKVVYLAAIPETIYERVHRSTSRPLLNGHMNVEYIAELLEKRRDKYEQAADIIIHTDGKSVKKICEKFIDVVIGS